MVFRGKYYFLSNMYPCPVTVDICGKAYVFTCSEAAFQAMKSPQDAVSFTGIDGYAAKRMGRRVKMDKGMAKRWNAARDSIMESIVRAKFMQNMELMEKLLTVDGEICEENTWNDRYWGVIRHDGRLYGENRLGKILMRLRDEERERRGDIAWIHYGKQDR